MQPLKGGQYVDLVTLAEGISNGVHHSYRGCMLLLDDFQLVSQHSLGVASALNLMKVKELLAARILISVSFRRISDKYTALIEELRYTSRSFPFINLAIIKI